MASPLASGDKVSGTQGVYVVDRLLNRGEFANTFAAKSGSRPVLLKQYSDPSTLFTPWFKKYKAYQDAIIQRTKMLNDHVVPVLEHFVFRDDYYQVHEWDTGSPVGERFKETRDLNRDFQFWLGHAKKFTESLAQLHESGVVHSDLKPDNLFLTPRGGETVLRIIDLDWSLQESSGTIPWDRGPRGTPFYWSPEHLNGGTVTYGSDVYTASLIIYKMLYDVHPIGDAFRGQTLTPEDAVQKVAQLQVTRGFPRPIPPKGGRKLYAPAEEMLWRSLEPDPRKRPSAKELAGGLLKAQNPPVRLILRDPGGLFIRISPEDHKQGKSILSREGNCRLLPSAAYMGRYQADLFPNVEGTGWSVAPPKDGSRPTNDTMVNGNAVKSPTVLRPGDHLQVGNAATGNKPVDLLVDFEPI